MTSQRDIGDADPSALPLHEARRRLLAAVAPVRDAHTVALRDALGRTLAVDVEAPMDVPPFRASAMDGYAFRASDVRASDDGDKLQVRHASLAGHPAPDALAPHDCVRITTGARLPDEADTVVQQENVERTGETVRLLRIPDRGHHVRDAGSDSRRGERLATAGTRLGAAALAALAAHGIDSVEVLRRPRVALLSTGDELREPGASLGPGQLHDANRTLLTGMLADLGVELVDLGIAADTPQALVEAMARGGDVDLRVSSGGVSVGDADHVRDVLDARGEVVFWKVAMKPGRPLAFGRVMDKPWIGLPGNPVSAAVTTLLLLRPALVRLCGRTPSEVPTGVNAVLDGALQKQPGRLEFQRGVLGVDATGLRTVTTAGLQESHGLRALAAADCLIELPADSRGARAGDTVTVHPFTAFAEPPL